MIRKILHAFIVVLLTANISYARSQVKGVGSSTVFPFVTTVAEEFGRNNSYKTPIIESTGTGGGFKLFCKGVGEKHPDISNASREIKPSEVSICKKNGVTDISEVKIGYDGIVLANSKKSGKFKLTTKQIFLGLAKSIPQGGKLVSNPYKKWSDIDKSLPARDIVVYGPPPTSGTRDAFVELVMHKSCMKLPEFLSAYPQKETRKEACGLMREDGAYLEAGENDNFIVQKLSLNKESLGIFGYSFLENNMDAVQGAIVDGKHPTFENISSEAYPISRSLFVYVKEQHYDKIVSLKDFVKELVSDDAIGGEGYLTYKGLIPVSPEELREVQRAVLGKL